MKSPWRNNFRNSVWIRSPQTAPNSCEKIWKPPLQNRNEGSRIPKNLDILIVVGQLDDFEKNRLQIFSRISLLFLSIFLVLLSDSENDDLLTSLTICFSKSRIFQSLCSLFRNFVRFFVQLSRVSMWSF